MAKTATTGVRERLVDVVAAVHDLLPIVRALLPESDGKGLHMGITRSAPESREPWNEAAAHAYWSLWIGTGNVANTLRQAAGLARWENPPRGVDALDAVLNYAPAVSDESVKLATLRLERWVDLARQLPAIDEAEPWTSVPAVGATPPACPYCGTFGLRMRKRQGLVVCFFPACVDRDGKPTRARMEPGRMTGEARLIFGDGTMLSWAGGDG